MISDRKKKNKSTYFDQKQRAFRHLGYAFDMHTSQVIFILQTTCHGQYENSIFRSLFSTQLTHNILRNFSKKFSPTWRSFNKFTLLLTSSKTQLIRSIIIPRWRAAHCFWSKYFENQARYKKVVKGLHI
jgi:hypothetical protein